MRDKIKKHLVSIGGKNIKITESSGSKEKKRKKHFITTVDRFKKVWRQSNKLAEEHGVNLVQYEDQYYRIIEHLIFEHYGQWVGEIIMWWVYEVDDPKKEDYYIKDEKGKKQYIIRTTNQLYTTLKKMKILK
mgnify:CR=1 FL=1|tara:strand:- start:772 stop:1167 length:396 start_codon:yes stop_codon:yes gene_type:complete